VPSPTTQIKSNRHNKNMLISENYDIKVTELEVNDKIGKQRINHEVIDCITSPKSRVVTPITI
jgi:hypothetical protein